MGNVEDAVREVFGPVNPREDIPFGRLASQILDVRKTVEGATPEDRKYADLALPSSSFFLT